MFKLILLNFSHPLTYDHLQQIEKLTRQKVGEIIELNAQVDLHESLIPQVVALVEKTGLSKNDWQTLPLLINPPSLNFIAVALLAELHGRCGYFPAHIRMRPVQGSVPPRYEVAEIMNLQEIRDAARLRR
ncbi:MAG: CRISPR-associated protein Csx15 [Bacillota bacterium]